MHIWTIDKWKNIYNLSDPNHRTGARLRFDNSVNPEVKRACKDFLKWVRKEYFFPIRVPIYVKSSESIIACDGEKVIGTCFLPDDHNIEPYIRIATGDYCQMLQRWGKDIALIAILRTIAHELTHYFQWVNALNLTPRGEERQATIYTDYILDEYTEFCKHP